jgi:plastocyanin
MRVTGIVSIVAAAVILAACGNETGPGGGHSTTISVKNNFFAPSPDTVAAGQITFNWDGGPHTVIWDSGPTDPGDIASRSSGSVQVTVANGTYGYHCSIHAGMNGVIVVQ